MKKSLNEFAAVSMCAVLSLSAFTLPAITKAYAADTQGVVESHDMPQEYMEGFDANEGTKYVDYNKLLVVVPTAQIEEMKTMAIAAFKNAFGLEVPQGFKFEHRSMRSEMSEDSKEIRTTLTWSDGTYGTDEASGKTQFFSATFISDAGMERPLRLDSLNIRNGVHHKNIEGLIETGKEYLAAEFHAQEDLGQMEIRTLMIANYENDGQNVKDISLQLGWDKDQSEYHGDYFVGFEHVDMENNTGTVTAAMNYVIIRNQEDIAFSEEQEAELLAAAQAFLSENNIPSPQLMDRPYAGKAAYRINQTMFFMFEYQTAEDGSTRYANVYIDSDKNILGFNF